MPETNFRAGRHNLPLVRYGLHWPGAGDRNDSAPAAEHAAAVDRGVAARPASPSLRLPPVTSQSRARRTWRSSCRRGWIATTPAGRDRGLAVGRSSWTSRVTPAALLGAPSTRAEALSATRISVVLREIEDGRSAST